MGWRIKLAILLASITTFSRAFCFANTNYKYGSAENQGSTQLYLWGDDLLYIIDAQEQKVSVQEIVRSDSPKAAGPRQNRQVWLGYPFEEPTAAAVDYDGAVYVVDAKIRTVFVIRPHDKPEVLFSGGPLLRPTGIAVNKDHVYIIDPEAKSIFSFSLATHEIYEEFHRSTAQFPDKIVWKNDKLYAYSRQSGLLIRLFAERDSRKETSDQGPSVTWSIPNSDPTGLKRGEVITFRQPWSDAIDFAVSREILYLLSPNGRQIHMFPLLGGQEVEFNLPSSFEGATRLAVSDENLCVLTPRGVISMATVVPATIDFDGGSVSKNLINLYLYLIQNRLLPTQEVKVRDGDSIAKLVADAGVLPSGYVDEFQSVFCQLNRHLCARGFSPEVLRVGSTVVLPDRLVKPFESRRFVELPLEPDSKGDPHFQRHLGGTLGELAKEFAVPSASDDETKKALLKLNYWYRGENILDERRGSFVIPSQSFLVNIALPEAHVLNGKSKLYGLLSKNVHLNTPIVYSGLQEKSFSKGRSLSEDPRTAINPPDKDASCVGVSNQDWNRVLEIIHYCLPANTEPSNIGVVEQHFDTTHPEFQLTSGDSSLQRYTTVVETAPTRSDSQQKFNREWDHGTHIAALVGGHLHAHRVLGIQPKSTIWGIKPADLAKALNVDPNEKDLSEVRVFNISLGERDPTEEIDSTAQLKKLVDRDIYLNDLFIIAAGGNHQPIQGLGDVLAKRSLRYNVIVVGASDLKNPPGLSTESDYGWEYMDILAPGENIESALYGGGYAPASGTSQATALVSGTAALLNALEPSWEPWKIKQRILSTADLWTDTANSGSVRTGILNVKTAVLNRTDAVLRFWVPPVPPGETAPAHSDAQPDKQCVGRIQYAGIKGSLTVLVAGELPRDIPIKNIRRFVRNSDNISFTILYTRTSNERTIQPANRIGLERVIGVQGLDLRGITKFGFAPENDSCGGKTTVELKDLAEMTNGFY
jgi:hypothetical protein